MYAELRRLAAGYLRSEDPGHTLQPTALVHEAFIRMIGYVPDCHNRSEFFGLAARLMRHILVDHARARGADKRGGGQVVRLTLEEDIIGAREQDADLMALDEALVRLAALDPRKAQVVELRFFAGLSVEETAEALTLSDKTVRRDWQFAKAWLLRELSGEKDDGS